MTLNLALSRPEQNLHELYWNCSYCTQVSLLSWTC